MLNESRIRKYLFAGYSPKQYAMFSWKALAGGAAGVFVGFFLTGILVSFVPYVYGAWPGYAVGYFVNIRVQAALKNFNETKSTPKVE